MAQILFDHPTVGTLEMNNINPNSIEWSYGMNTQSYPTYGGEVVQILSCYIDDITITGDLRLYSDAENVHAYFINYMQAATQGTGHANSPRFDTTPVKFTYVERGWTFDIYPKSLPAFKWGRDVIVPTWTVTAAVSEVGNEITDILVDQALQSYMAGQGVEFFGTATAGIGFKEDNPFSGLISEDQKDINKLADFFNNLIPAYMESDFSDLTASYSKPAFLARRGNNSSSNDVNTGTRQGTQDAKDATPTTQRGNP